MELSITQALAELKLLDKRIGKLIAQADLVSYKEGINGKVQKLYTYEEYSNNAKSDLDAINDLIVRRDKINNTIFYSNAITKVKINGEEKTVSEVINSKLSYAYKKTLLDKVRRQFNDASTNIRNINENLDNKIERTTQAALSNKDKKENEIGIIGLEKSMKELQEAILIDPIKIHTFINNIDKEIDEFESNVDYILSESNAKTVISID
jgi:hypothetical protein